MKKIFSRCLKTQQASSFSGAELTTPFQLTDENLHPKKFNIFDPWPNSPVANFVFVTLLHTLFAGGSLIFGSLIHAEVTPSEAFDPTVIGAAFAGAAIVSAGVRLTLLSLHHVLKPLIESIAACSQFLGAEQDQLARQQKLRPHYLHTVPLVLALVFGLKVSGGLMHMTATHDWPISLWSGVLGLLAATLVSLASLATAMFFSKDVRDYVEENMPDWTARNDEVDVSVTSSETESAEGGVVNDVEAAVQPSTYFEAHGEQGIEVVSPLANFVAANGVAGTRVSTDGLEYEVGADPTEEGYGIVQKPGEDGRVFTSVDLLPTPSLA
jgi:hypothetical protein